MHVFLGGQSDGLYRTAILSTVQGAPVDLRNDRLAGATGSFRRLVVASCYGCDWDPDIAARGAEQAVQELRQNRERHGSSAWGDFNGEAMQEPLAQKLAAGMAWSWDEPFEVEQRLPGTRETDRRNYLALGCGGTFRRMCVSDKPSLIRLRSLTPWRSIVRWGTAARHFAGWLLM